MDRHGLTTQKPCGNLIHALSRLRRRPSRGGTTPQSRFGSSQVCPPKREKELRHGTPENGNAISKVKWK